MSEAVKASLASEITYALVAVVLFAVLVVGIGISAFLRPAGEHPTAQTAEPTVAVAEAGVE